MNQNQVYKVMQSRRDVGAPSDELAFDICFVDTKTGEMLETKDIGSLLDDLISGKAKLIKDDVGYFIAYS